MGDQSRRGEHLSRLLHAFVAGKRSPSTSNDVQLYIQAICSQDDHAACIEKVGCSKVAVEALGKGLRFDTSINFINGPLNDLLSYIAAPAVKRLCNGEFLKRLLSVVVSPPTLWNAVVLSQQKGELSSAAELGFAWVLLETLCWPDGAPTDVEDVARIVTDTKEFIEAENRDLRTLGYRIDHILRAKTSNHALDSAGPGGRHDNDFTSYRQIAIYPTEDELTSKDRPFYSPASALRSQPSESRVGFHLDNQFRLLREDFLAELRDGRETAVGRKKRTLMQGLQSVGLHCGDDRKRSPFAVTMSVEKGLGGLTSIAVSGRRAFLKNTPNYLKHNSFGQFVDQGQVIAFGFLLRVEDLLLQDPPVVTIRTPGAGDLGKVLLALKTSRTLDFQLMDTAVFAYEPVLRCLQGTVELPLSEQLLGTQNAKQVPQVHDLQSLHHLAGQIEDVRGQDLQSILDLPTSVKLDDSQTESLLSGLRQSISLIQGPPGTGKSFIGALLAKAIHEHTGENILVICYTNHALDQYLEELLDAGIPAQSMVRLGSKSTAKTQHLSIRAQAHHRSPNNWNAINQLNAETDEQVSKLQSLMGSYVKLHDSRSEMMQHLEFAEEDRTFFDAFQLPEIEDGMTVVGDKGKAVGHFYLLDRWMRGEDAGVFSTQVPLDHSEIWDMNKSAREEKSKAWLLEILSEAVDDVAGKAAAYNASQATLHEALQQSDAELIQRKRIVACTTTAAAMYAGQLRSAAPGIILVEEAGEILESHVLTALTPSTQQLILIGDHQQLRPKVNNYSLTVEKGDGYDLNRSLFERLVLSGFSHTTLKQQHRMCPEISALVRQLTYPGLMDAPSVTKREPLRGLRSRVVFIKHEKLELASRIADRRDEGAPISKENGYEAELVLKVVKYMAQQGYGTSEQVVLTPYLGQLSLLRRELARENDPVLSDIDSFDLIRAGVLSPASASQTKQPIKLSTIDNYQGEESDVVIVSLTRSNENGDIGFMVSPERLNVLLSRARKALIIIGNPATFLASRKGGEMWKSFFAMLAENNQLFDGLPVRCEQHPDRELLLATPADFTLHCPDGGCSAPCGVLLECGLHECPQKCHRSGDHTKTKCAHKISDTCPRRHVLTRKCSDGHPASCHICDAEDRAKAEQQARDFELEQARQAKQREYASQLAVIQAEIDRHRRDDQAIRDDEDQQATMKQRLADLENVKSRTAQREATKRAATDKGTPKSNPGLASHGTRPSPATEAAKTSAVSSEARVDWERQKSLEGAKNVYLDELMGMIGLENVKDQFLEIKSRIDLAIRQDISMGKERFGAALLGNPGTGKTTVARIYANFLFSVGALPGNHFKEVTGASLASNGVKACETLLDDIKNEGGGALFIDEAYQLTSGASPGGAAVLDFLLPEVENLTGKVVFILAGYNKQMEKFFAHNPGLPSRFPCQLQFADYEDHELLEIINYNISKRYDGRMKVEDGSHGLHNRIVARRLGRGRGKEGFGNARAVENNVSKIAARQAKRLRRQRAAKMLPDDFLFTKEDLIGPEPSVSLSGNTAWIKLQKMVGLESVKESIKALLDSIQFNYQRELNEEPLVEFSLNKVFLGSPGTGKTSVAKLYAKILGDLGLLSSGEVVVKKPADFVGGVLGASEANTKGILDAAIGKVLLIDEAYGLYGGSEGGTADPYRSSVIDTIVAEVQGVPGDDRCVLLLGYKEQMEDMMQNVNPGLARRFPIDSGFVFEDFTEEEMVPILDMKLKEMAFQVTPRAKTVAMEVLRRARNRPNFGNAGAVDILLNDAKIRHQKRLAKHSIAAKATFEAQDFDPDFDRGEQAGTNIAVLFKDSVGCESIVQQLQGYQAIAANMKQLDLDPREIRQQIPFSFLFRGPPGTGKTTTAKKMGKVYYDMGFLTSTEVVTCSASDIVGQYVGQTGPKTRKVLESALGKILFIDEAYRLSSGHFAKEAMDELVDCMTNDKYHRKLIIILAGYDADINNLMSKNPGLTSRFADTIVFSPLGSRDCLDLLINTLGQKKLGKTKSLDISVLRTSSKDFETTVLDRFATLSALDNFANARDVQNVAKNIFGAIMKRKYAKTDKIVLTEKGVIEALDNEIAERSRRAADAATAGAMTDNLCMSLPTQAPRTNANKIKIEQNVKSAHAKQELTAEQARSPTIELPDDESTPPPAILSKRDAGVSDAIWNQLQADILKAEQEEQAYRHMHEEERKLREWLEACADSKRRQQLEELERKRKAVEEQRRKDAQVQEKLRVMGRCPVGYAWIKQSDGYRCAGGSHWIPESQVESLLQG